MVVSRANELSERVLGVGRDQTASNVRKLKRYLVSLLLVVSVSAVRTQCRTSGAALFCTGQFERPIGFKGDTNYVRDWDRKCPISSVVECVILFARGMDCQDVTDPCGLQAYKVNSILCHKTSTMPKTSPGVEAIDETTTPRRNTERSWQLSTETPSTQTTGVDTEKGGETLNMTLAFTVPAFKDSGEIPVREYGVISGLSGLCLFLLACMLCVCKKKRLYLFKPRMSPIPLRRCPPAESLSSGSSYTIFP